MQPALNDIPVYLTKLNQEKVLEHFSKRDCPTNFGSINDERVRVRGLFHGYQQHPIIMQKLNSPDRIQHFRIVSVLESNKTVTKYNTAVSTSLDSIETAPAVSGTIKFYLFPDQVSKVQEFINPFAPKKDYILFKYCCHDKIVVLWAKN